MKKNFLSIFILFNILFLFINIFFKNNLSILELKNKQFEIINLNSQINSNKTIINDLNNNVHSLNLNLTNNKNEFQQYKQQYDVNLIHKEDLLINLEQLSLKNNLNIFIDYNNIYDYQEYLQKINSNNQIQDEKLNSIFDIEQLNLKNMNFFAISIKAKGDYNNLLQFIKDFENDNIIHFKEIKQLYIKDINKEESIMDLLLFIYYGSIL